MLYYTSIHVRFGVEKLRVPNSPGPRPPNPFFPRQLRRSWRPASDLEKKGRLKDGIAWVSSSNHEPTICFFLSTPETPKNFPKVSPQSCIMKKTNRRVHNFHPDVWDKNPEVGSNRHVTFCMVDLGLEFLALTFFFLFLFDKLINVWKKNTWMQGPEPRCSQFLTLIEMLLKSLEHHRLGFAKYFLTVSEKVWQSSAWNMNLMTGQPTPLEKRPD